jgi:hypothetical protein
MASELEQYESKQPNPSFARQITDRQGRSELTQKRPNLLLRAGILSAFQIQRFPAGHLHRFALLTMRWLVISEAFKRNCCARLWTLSFPEEDVVGLVGLDVFDDQAMRLRRSLNTSLAAHHVSLFVGWGAWSWVLLREQIQQCQGENYKQYDSAITSVHFA